MVSVELLILNMRGSFILSAARSVCCLCYTMHRRRADEQSLPEAVALDLPLPPESLGQILVWITEQSSSPVHFHPLMRY